MILARVRISEDESVWKLLNCSQLQMRKRYVEVLDAYEVSLSFVIEAIREKLSK